MDIYYVHYLTSANTDFGVKNKIKSQLASFEANGFNTFDIEIKRKIHDSLLTKIIRHLYPEPVPPLLLNIKNSVIYFRGSLVDINHYQLFKKLKKQGNIIAFEIPTFPFKKECKGLRRLQYYLHLLWIWQVKKNIDFFVGISYYSKIYNTDTVSTENGINPLLYTLKKQQELEKTINVIIVAHLCNYHGVDRFISGLANYYQKKNNQFLINLHIVGDGQITDELKQMAIDLGVSQYCIFYGLKTGDELDSLYDQAHIGLASIGLHRINIFEASVLKSREYFAKGLPFITSVRIPDIPDKLEYIKFIPANDTPVSIDEIITYTKKVYTIPDFDLQIRNWTESNLSWTKKMKPVIDKINEITKLKTN